MPMSWIDFMGYAAALAVLGAFCMTGIIPLRVLAIVSNILFAAYGILAHLYPVFLLHLVLLPINLGKLMRLLQGERGALVRSGGRGRAKKSELRHRRLLRTRCDTPRHRRTAARISAPKTRVHHSSRAQGPAL